MADETRIRIIGALQGRELCLCQLIECLGHAPSTVSKHLSVLRNARLIESRKEGRWMSCRLAGPDAPAPVLAAIGWVNASFAESSQSAPDRERLEEILKIDPEILCSRHPRSGT